MLFAFALTEPGAGSDVAALATSARPEGDAYVLDGEKRFVPNARGLEPRTEHFACRAPVTEPQELEAQLR